MKKYKLEDMKNGWIIGDFEPSVLKTKDFEAGLLTHKKGEEWPVHYHAKAIEYNVVINGRIAICGTEVGPGDIFVFEKMEVADPVFLEDSLVLVIKVPSVPGDKHLV